MGYIATGAVNRRAVATSPLARKVAASPLARKVVAEVAEAARSARTPLLSIPARGSSLSITTSVPKTAPPLLLAPVAPTRRKPSVPVIPSPSLGTRKAPPTRASSPYPSSPLPTPDKVVEVPVSATTTSSTSNGGGGGGGGGSWSGGGASAMIDDFDFELPGPDLIPTPVGPKLTIKVVGLAVAAAVGVYFAVKKWG
jgi:uncharacterized membrane protein YgcG